MRQSGGAETATMKLFRRPLRTLRFRGEVVPSSPIRSAAIKCPEKKKNNKKNNVKEGFIWAHSLKVQSTMKGSLGSIHLKMQLLTTHPQPGSRGR